ncbi:hypothetical protein U9M48_028920, partial [Paspalum notatum var. saurae]
MAEKLDVRMLRKLSLSILPLCIRRAARQQLRGHLPWCGQKVSAGDGGDCGASGLKTVPSNARLRWWKFWAPRPGS